MFPEWAAFVETEKSGKKRTEHGVDFNNKIRLKRVSVAFDLPTQPALKPEAVQDKGETAKDANSINNKWLPEILHKKPVKEASSRIHLEGAERNKGEARKPVLNNLLDGHEHEGHPHRREAAAATEQSPRIQPVQVLQHQSQDALFVYLPECNILDISSIMGLGAFIRTGSRPAGWGIGILSTRWRRSKRRGENGHGNSFRSLISVIIVNSSIPMIIYSNASIAPARMARPSRRPPIMILMSPKLSN